MEANKTQKRSRETPSCDGPRYLRINLCRNRSVAIGLRNRLTDTHPLWGKLLPDASRVCQSMGSRTTFNLGVDRLRLRSSLTGEQNSRCNSVKSVRPFPIFLYSEVKTYDIEATVTFNSVVFEIVAIPTTALEIHTLKQAFEAHASLSRYLSSPPLAIVQALAPV